MKYQLTLQASTGPITEDLGDFGTRDEAIVAAMKYVDRSFASLMYNQTGTALNPKGFYARHDFGPDTYLGDGTPDDALKTLCKVGENPFPFITLTEIPTV